LVLSILLALYGAVWEYSTRRYLKGFSDAVVLASTSDEDKIKAILNWMAHGPARRGGGPEPTLPNRDPIHTLNYASLLQVCGTATNAFVNLANSAGLVSRRLLLQDSRRLTKHVVAEVLLDDRWIVVDPSFHVIWRGADGRPLTREELADPAVFSEVTRAVPSYSPQYTFDRTAHIHLSRMKAVGRFLRRSLDRWLPGWENSATLSLLLERESLAALLAALLLVLFFFLVRAGLRRYGEKRLGLRTMRIHDQFQRALSAFMDAGG